MARDTEEDGGAHPGHEGAAPDGPPDVPMAAAGPDRDTASRGAPPDGRPGRPAGRAATARALTGAVFALAGLIFATSFNTARGTDLRTDASLLRLSDLVQERSRKNAALGGANASTRRDVDALAERDHGTSPADEAKLADLERKAGTQPMTGAGVTVTLDDAPPDATAAPGYPPPGPDDLVIHQQDLQAVVNTLWQGGARGIRVMDQRLIATSAVRCVGNQLILQGRVYSPPYRITAVGDPGALRAALDASAPIRNYLLYVQAYGLGWSVRTEDRTTLAGYAGTTELHYAKPVGGRTG